MVSTLRPETHRKQAYAWTRHNRQEVSVHAGNWIAVGRFGIVASALTDEELDTELKRLSVDPKKVITFRVRERQHRSFRGVKNFG